MWLGDEFEASNLEIATQGWRSPDAAVGTAEGPPTLELSDAELSQLAEDEGWDATEVEAIRSLLGRATDQPNESPPEQPAKQPAEQREEPPIDSPPANHDAASTKGLEDVAADPAPASVAGGTSVLPSGPPTSAPPKETMEPEAVEPPVEPSGDISGTNVAALDAGWQPVQRLEQRTAPPPIGDPDWLKGRRGPAATAYRRLRKLFPG